MNFLELTQKLRFHCGVSGIGPTSVTGQTGEYERLVNWISDAWVEIQNLPGNWAYLWKQDTYNTVAGTMDYDILTNQNIKKIDKQKVYAYDTAVGRAAIYRLQFMEYPVWVDRYFTEDQTEQKKPEYFTILPDHSMRLWPNPDGIYHIDLEGFQPATFLANDADEPAMHPQYHMAIVFYAMMTYAGYEFAPEIAQLGAQRWAKFYDEMKKHMLIKTHMASRPFA